MSARRVPTGCARESRRTRHHVEVSHRLADEAGRRRAPLPKRLEDEAELANVRRATALAVGLVREAELIDEAVVSGHLPVGRRQLICGGRGRRVS
jgi:hypothetical protein